MTKNIVFFGSPLFSAEILKSILKTPDYQVIGVVTTPDRPIGRKQLLTPSPVAQLAQDHNLPTYKPTKLDDNNLSHLKLLKPDLFLVVSYGQIIPQNWLDTPSIGTFNLHFSLLPKYRGALCISEAIKNQDQNTGVTLMKMDAQLDHGPIISQLSTPIDKDDNVATLTTKLTQLGQETLASKLPEICAQNYPSTPQDENLVTYTPSHKTISHQTAFIPYQDIEKAIQKDGQKIHALIRSLNPEPGAWTKINNQEIKVISSSLDQDNKLVLNTVQIPGKNPISWKQFLSGHSQTI